MKIIRNICRYLVGIVFIFSGTVKAIDPLGSVYKFQDYFQAFHLGFLKEFSLLLTILLCTIEFIAGFSLFFNIRQRAGLILALLLMLFFTPLTFILALTNPVTDCGCFGDAIHLTNWQSFLKNIILFIPVIYLFISRREVLPEPGKIRSWIK
ncbi:MAG: MauE/DoxX family redox-associated membrane protein, partial [Bacteroidales bacterium]